MFFIIPVSSPDKYIIIYRCLLIKNVINMIIFILENTFFRFVHNNQNKTLSISKT